MWKTKKNICKIGMSFLFLSTLFSCTKNQSEKPVQLDLKKINRSLYFDVSPYYLSYAIDLAQVVGGAWWDASTDFKKARGGTKAQALNFSNQALIRYAKELSPAILRFGGTEADFLYYSKEEEAETTPKNYDSVLTLKRWDQIYEFSQASGAKLFFTLNASYENWSSGVWKEQYSTLWEHIQRNDQQVYALELGNENNAFWIGHGISQQVSSNEYAKNYLEAKSFFGKLPLLAGPANAFWPYLGEVFSWVTVDSEKILQKTKGQLDVLSYHYYPSQSKRCPIAVVPANEENFRSRSFHQRVSTTMRDLKKKRDKWSPHTEIWLGETGSAQCGGEAGVSDSYFSGFWWMHQLGLGALYDTKVQIRQSLVGADYGMLDPITFQPRVDYYLSLLWKRSMGTRAYAYRMEDSKSSIFVHCAVGKKNKLSWLILNFDSPQEFLLPKGSEYLKITGGDGGGSLLINGEKLDSLARLNQIAKLKEDKLLLNELEMAFVYTDEDLGLCH